MNLYMHTVSLNKLNPIISETLDSLEPWPKCRYDFVAIICPRALVVGCVLIQPSDSHSPPLSAQSFNGRRLLYHRRSYKQWRSPRGGQGAGHVPRAPPGGGTEMTIGQKNWREGEKKGKKYRCCGSYCWFLTKKEIKIAYHFMPILTLVLPSLFFFYIYI